MRDAAGAKKAYRPIVRALFPICYLLFSCSYRHLLYIRNMAIFAYPINRYLGRDFRVPNMEKQVPVVKGRVLP
jgi:hypothetical protein